MEEVGIWLLALGIILMLVVIHFTESPKKDPFGESSLTRLESKYVESPGVYLAAEEGLKKNKD